jgi:hypothetical protein
MIGQLTTTGKAFEINDSLEIYGTFAEIGAGQEVARHFFQAGKASQTIAKTISAYDMTYSDEIYGKESSGRYVCESRLFKMLDKEYNLLLKRLSKTRGDKSTFFAYANTVTTGDQTKRQSHGWMGVRFQTSPNTEPNDIILHVRMLDRYRLDQQESLGILGVNLVHAAFFKTQSPYEFIPSLVDNLKDGQVVINMIRVSGPAFKRMNNHILNLELVRRGLAEAVLFAPDKEILNVSDSVFGKSIIVERGSFKPFKKQHLEIMNKANEFFQKTFPKTKSPLLIFEMTMHEHAHEGIIDEASFLERVKTLTASGHHVLVSNFFLFYKLKNYLRMYTKEPMAMTLGATMLEKIFEEKYYDKLEGGLLEGLGKLLDSNTRLLVFPQGNKAAKDFAPKSTISNIHKYFVDNAWILGVD